MPNRIDEFADAFQGWMAEWEASRKLASNEQRPIQDSCGAEKVRTYRPEQPEMLPSAPAGMDSLRQSQEIANLDDLGIQYEPDWRDEEPYWSDSQTTAERYSRGGK